MLNYLQSLGNPQTTNIPGANKTCCTPPFTGIYTMAFNVGSYQTIEEKTFAPYLNLNTKSSIADMPLPSMSGCATIERKRSLRASAQLPTTLTVQASDHTAFLVAYTGTVPVRDHEHVPVSAAQRGLEPAGHGSIEGAFGRIAHL